MYLHDHGRSLEMGEGWGRRGRDHIPTPVHTQLPMGKHPGVPCVLWRTPHTIAPHCSGLHAADFKILSLPACRSSQQNAAGRGRRGWKDLHTLGQAQGFHP